MGILDKLFGKKLSIGGDTQVVKPKPGTCMVCGKAGLRFIIEYTRGQCSLGEVGMQCVRCENLICKGCLSKLPKHADGFGFLCPVCNKYSIFELAGHHEISRLARESEKRYGK